MGFKNDDEFAIVVSTPSVGYGGSNGRVGGTLFYKNKEKGINHLVEF